MSNGVGCFFEEERVEIGEAAKNYDDVQCSGCPHHHDCKTMKAQETEVRGDQNGSH
jgi:hypothetical protein